MGFTNRAIAWFDRLGVEIERVMTNNDSAHKSHAFGDLLAGLEVKHTPIRQKRIPSHPAVHPIRSLPSLWATGSGLEKRSPKAARA